MAHLITTHRATALAGAVAGAALAMSGLAAIPAQAAPAGSDTPQLSIAVDNGVDSAERGDRLSYTVTVTNLGTARVEDLLITQNVPSGATFVSAGERGKQASGSVSWSIELPATKKVVLHTVMTVGTTPDTLLRMATVSCAKTSPTGAPIVCASDSDQLPAGAAANAAVTPGAATGPLSQPSWRYAGGGVGLVVVAAVLWLVVRRRRA